MNPPITINGLNHQSEQPLMDPAAALPSLPYGSGIGSNQIQNLVSQARAQLGTQEDGDHALRAAVGADELRAHVEQLRQANPAAAASMNAEAQVVMPGDPPPAVYAQQQVTSEAQVAASLLGPDVAARLLGTAPPPAQGTQVATPTPAPPQQQTQPAPQMSAQDQQIAALTQQVAQMAAMQQQQYQAAEQAQWQAQQAAQARQASAWKDPAVRDAALQQIGVDLADPAHRSMGRFVHDTFHQQQERAARLEQALMQQGQMLQQLHQIVDGFRSGAQTITLQNQVGAKASTDFAQVPQAARDAVVQNTLYLAQQGLSPQEAYARASAPLRAHIQHQPRPQAPPPPASVVNAMALGGGGLGAAPVLPGSGRSFQAGLPSLPSLDAQFAQMLLGQGRG